MTAAETTPAPVPGTTPRNKNSIGPELGIGFALGNYTTDPVMCLKSCIGGRSLGWDLLPPTQKSFDYTDPTTKDVYTYAGYHQSPNKFVFPRRWLAFCSFVTPVRSHRTEVALACAHLLLFAGFVVSFTMLLLIKAYQIVIVTIHTGG